MLFFRSPQFPPIFLILELINPSIIAYMALSSSLFSSSSSSLVFTVRRQEPELITPAKPTPHDFRQLSDIDDQLSLRFQIPVIQFYRKVESMRGEDPVRVIREAIAKALVFYYPLAGRLREGPGKKLTVDCNGEGLLFIEADADVRIEEFGDALQPPFPCLDQLLYDVPGYSDILNCPLVLVQVTRLKCGGFIVALRLNHTISDGTGLVQFMNAIAEMARGQRVPSQFPVWQRHLLFARDPPRVTCAHREYAELPSTFTPDPTITHRSFFFRRRDLAVVRHQLPPHLRNCSTTFEILSALMWRSRTIALSGRESKREVCVFFIVNARAKFKPELPAGYYGNVFVFPAAAARAEELCRRPLEYAVELVRKAKAEVTEEYVRSVADLMVLTGRRHFPVDLEGTYIVSDVTHAGFRDVDYGWGKAVFAGPARAGGGEFPAISFFTAFKNERLGEDGIVVPVGLPLEAMERLETEIRCVIRDPMPPIAIFQNKSSL